MVQVSGTTYRILERAGTYEVIRLHDDRFVGSFRHDTALELTAAEISPATLGQIARHAHRSARLRWSQPRADHSRLWTTLQERVGAAWIHAVTAIRGLLAALHPLTPRAVLTRRQLELVATVRGRG